MNKETFNKIYGELVEDPSFYFDTLLMRSRWELMFLIVFKILNLIMLQVQSIIHPQATIFRKNILLCLTSNQSRSLLSLSNNNNLIIRPFLDSAKIKGVKVVFFSPFFYILDMFRMIVWFSKYDNIPILLNIYLSVSYFYYYNSFVNLFKCGTNSVTITNPSHPILRAAIIAAEKNKIRTIYMPHAHPSKRYPQINTNFALLEGLDGLNYYSFSVKTKKMLVGAIRLDPYKGVMKDKHDGINILIATNLLDDMKKVKKLIKALVDKKPFDVFNIILRPHPNQILDVAFLNQFSKIEVSDSKINPCIEDLKRTDILISANSTIFFEAVYLPISCYYYDFILDSVKEKDSYELHSYSFVKFLSDLRNLDIVTEPNFDDIKRVDYSYYKNRNSLSVISTFYNQYLYKCTDL